MPAADEIHRLIKRRLPAGFLAGVEYVKHNGQFNSSLSRLNLIFSRQPNFLATTLGKYLRKNNMSGKDQSSIAYLHIMLNSRLSSHINHK